MTTVQTDWIQQVVNILTDTYLELAKSSGKADGASEIAIQLDR